MLERRKLALGHLIRQACGLPPSPQGEGCGIAAAFLRFGLCCLPCDQWSPLRSTRLFGKSPPVRFPLRGRVRNCSRLLTVWFMRPAGRPMVAPTEYASVWQKSPRTLPLEGKLSAKQTDEVGTHQPTLTAHSTTYSSAHRSGSDCSPSLPGPSQKSRPQPARSSRPA